MTTVEERREVALRLRELDNSDLQESLICAYLDALGIKGYEDWIGIAHRLADLIDRPTCRMEECTIDHGSRSWGMRCTACGNDFEHMKPGFGWRYCPNCGAEVVSADD